MPALFVYLIVVGLLLGGGYGALSWLAAPEPVNVVARVKPKMPSAAHFTENYAANSEPASPPPPEASRPEPDSSGLSGSDRTKTAANDRDTSGDRALPPQPEHDAAASKPEDVPTQRDLHAQGDRQTPSARAEASPVEAEHEPRQRNKQPAAAAQVAHRSLTQQAAHHPEKKRALQLMTLRTIEYPDGRRVSQLIPYRGGAPGSGPDE